MSPQEYVMSGLRRLRQAACWGRGQLGVHGELHTWITRRRRQPCQKKKTHHILFTEDLRVLISLTFKKPSDPLSYSELFDFKILSSEKMGTL